MGITLEYKDVENKLLLLYLINLMELPMSRSQIAHFVVGKLLMDANVLLQSLNDMVAKKFLEETREDSQDESTTRYSLTDEGLTNLNLLENQIPRPMLNIIERYVEENRGKIKKGYEKAAHYYPSKENEDEYIVKCVVLDDKRGTTLMEIQVPVITREQAKFIQSNWNENYASLYQRILSILTE